MKDHVLNSIAASRKALRHEESLLVRKLTGGRREVPVIPFFDQPGLICEVKRASPSRGTIIGSEQPEHILEDYISAGVRRFSVLTERNYFSGSCEDLYRMKRRWKDKPFLRKDFLLSEDDVAESYQLGADALLLIGELLSEKQMQQLIRKAHSFGLQVLAEVHSSSLASRILSFPRRYLPDALGINARDLRDFTVNTLLPFTAAAECKETLPVIFESGVDHDYTAFLAGNAGFHGVLIGEACMTPAETRRETVSSLASSFHNGSSSQPVLLTRLMQRYRKRPLVKICGITSREDAELACSLGADMLGIILAPSPRQVHPSFLKEISDLEIIRCAVVCEPDEAAVKELLSYISEGLIDGVQLHGNTSSKLLCRFSGNAYNAAVIDPDRPELQSTRTGGPFVLYDLPKGNAGKTILDAADRKLFQGRCIAGGITPENLLDVLAVFSPVMIDISSGAETSPGKKDPDKLKKIFSKLEQYYG